MRITKIETINFTRGIQVHAGNVSWLWIRLHSDQGLIGLGETYPAAEVAEAHYLRHYQGIVTHTGLPQEGCFQAPSAPGLGVELDPSVFTRPDVLIQSVGK